MREHRPATARRLGFIAVAGGFVAVTIWGNLRPTELAAQPPAGGPPPASRMLFPEPGCGAGAGANCHGNNVTAAARGADYWKVSEDHFRTLDPHRNAYPALAAQNGTAAKIMERLKPYGYAEKATDEVRCLACHTDPTAAGLTDPNPRTKGVLCQTCHGGAKDWNGEHNRFHETPGERGKKYDDTGMKRLYDPVVRATTCVGCHVGAPADKDAGIPVRDMNHDMIAAGHPRLNFDLTNYTTIYVKKQAEKKGDVDLSVVTWPHWLERDRLVGDGPKKSGYQTQWWQVGRLAAAEALVKLHADRHARSAAEGGKPVPVPTPEFSDYNCFACHHSLNNGWRSDAPNYYAGRKPGAIYLNNAFFGFRPDLLTADESAACRKFMANPNGGPDAVALASALAAAKDRAAKGGNVPPAAFLKSAILSDADLDRLDWDQSQDQFYALYAVWLDILVQPDYKAKEATHAEIGKLFDPKLIDALPTPLKVSPGKTGSNSPTDFTPAKVRDVLKQLQDKLQTVAGQ